ncbi:hypothetical protein [Mucilaginibacter ginkgonis]|uniref:Uncharacterized protein n=1 Tax=Mucilaginibacter ginkgonis TaxID=2682091 RepID=A0A6I4IMF3_9SPHI|nr:hypothetical protein [Mucilaginibacter ginkgonis]QQL50446.1 hypothetical protein GO620_003035 [Mucilaginibacter ginkgonis]
MKKTFAMLAVVAALLFSLNVKAQSSGTYFIGKWNVTVFGTPNGDAKLTFNFSRGTDGKLVGGAIQDSTGKEVSKVTSLEEKDKTINAAFNIQGYDVTLFLEPVDEQNVKGNLMNMFDAKGVRVKEGK